MLKKNFRGKNVDLSRMVMDCRSNLRTYKKIFACHVYLIKMYDLKFKFHFAIKLYCWALCLGPNFSRKKKMLTCAGWLWIIAPTLVYCQKVTPTTYTLYSRMTYASTSVVRKNVAPEYQSLYNVKIFFSRKKNVDLDRMVMDCRSNIHTYKKIFEYHVYLVITNDLWFEFHFAIKWYSLALCLGPNHSQKKKNVDLRRMVMGYSSNLSLLPKSDTCHLYLVPTNDLQFNSCCWEKCSNWVPVVILGVKIFFRGKKTSTCAGWSWTAGPTFVFDKKPSHATCTL